MPPPKKKQGQTSDQHGTTQVTGTLKYDYVTVVGSYHISRWTEFRGNYGNKMSFINQGVGQLRDYLGIKKGAADKTFFLLFTAEYDPKMRATLKELVVNKYKAEYLEIDSADALVAFINKRVEEKREIKQLDIFAHGVVFNIEFGYEIEGKDATYRFGPAQASQLKPEAFALGANIFSYACRTGLGVDETALVSEGQEHYELSLAQKLADATGATIHAYPRRSLYDQTYGSEKDRDGLDGARERVASDAKAKSAFRIRQRGYERRLAEYRLSKKDDTLALPGESAPVQPPEQASENDKKLLLHADSRAKNEKNMKFPLDDYGAVGKVRSGSTPLGPPKQQLKFKKGQLAQP
ncbi:hypothetical protein [Pseudomonas sp. COW5]|uniref:hypothetical protein n=1 Tax=Pseudomonas sp. COW5 TaxID=2981253 RepID=UPI0022462923|nr:hypothetical protein [Pseudomonas sp. COW5]MCX2546065.1 hypothetical protein [Pseudomonas sp. COW5]